MINKRRLTALFSALVLALPFAASAYDAGDWIVRTGPINVDPDADSSAISLGGAALPGTSVDVEDDTQLGITFTYMMSDQIGVELLAATPFEHDITEKGVGVNKVGSTKQLPPTLSLQYYPMGANSNFQPYIGAGLNYTVFFSEDTSSELEAALGESDMELDDSFGLALQLGFDYSLNENWGLHANVWRMDIDTDAKIKTEAGEVTVDVEIDPYVFLIGAAYKF